MKVVEGFPPNIELIRLALPFSPNAIYCYGEKVFNPTGKEIPEDVLYHEQVHVKQQGELPEQWWNRYLTDTQFRLEQEVEAYAAQYQFVKRHYPSKAHKEALFDMASTLSSPMYNVGISYQQAESMIRLKNNQ